MGLPKEFTEKYQMLSYNNADEGKYLLFIIKHYI